MIKGTIKLKDGTTINITDETVVSGSVKYSMSTSTGGQFDVGTFNAAKLNISIYDEQSAGREFDTAEITLSEGDTEEALIKTGTYYVDGTQTDRRGRVVKLVAYDAATKFDVDIPEEWNGNSYTPEALVEKLCGYIGIELVADIDFSQFPNYNVNSAAIGTSKAVQTCRDVVMWICRQICCNAVITRDGKLDFRRAKYTSDGDGNINVDYTFTADDREDITFSDIRTYIKYLTAYNGDGATDYISAYTSTDSQSRAAMFVLPENQLLSGLSTLYNINTAWLKYIDGFNQREIKATVFDGAKVKLGDTCRFSGGKIDIGRRIIGVVTDITRTYNGKTVLICRAPKAVEAELDTEEGGETNDS